METFPEPCLYCQLGNNINDEEQDNETPTDELHVIPSEEIDLLSLFEALSYAASINPDPIDEHDQEDDANDDFIFNADEVELGAEQAKRLEHWDTLLSEDAAHVNKAGKFDDADIL